ncbi:MAG: hypothetical protein M1827_002126 [Pycnora praestabilis]|nr:MAG: hypothetical protein M1827_002126 [Pycnora praestabilis]
MNSLVITLVLLSIFSSFAIGTPLPDRCRHNLWHIFSCEPTNVPPVVGISPSQLANFNLFAQYSAAAYCPSNNGSPLTRVKCSKGNCPLVEAANAKTTTEFQNGFFDNTGFIAVDDSNKLIVLAIRGSQSFQNWVDDMAMMLLPVPWICPGCEVHAGWWGAWSDMRESTKKALKKAEAENPGYKVVVTGHSLGGAVATLAAMDLRKNGFPKADVFTFGSPRVANEKMSAFISSQAGGTHRITHTNDLVPKLPPHKIFGYANIQPEWHIERGNLSAEIGPEDINVYSGPENTDADSGSLLGAHLRDKAEHKFYFGFISACGPGLKDGRDLRALERIESRAPKKKETEDKN